MSLFDLLDIGYNILEKYESDDSVLIKNQYEWELYVLQNDNTNEDIYKGNILRKAIEYLKNRVVLFSESRKLESLYKALCYETKFLSDEEVKLGNLYSKWKYPTNNVLLIDSLCTDLLLNLMIREDKKKCVKTTDEIDVHLIENNDIVKINDEKFYRWNHGCGTLSNQLSKFVEENGFLFLNNCYNYHWNFLFGVIEEDKNGKGFKARVYVFDSMNEKNRESSDNHPTIIPVPNKAFMSPTDLNTRLFSLIKLMKLFLFVNKYYSLDGKRNIIVDKEKNSILIRQNLQEVLRSFYNNVTNVNYVYVSQQNDGYSCGLHVINYFHSILKLIHNNQASKEYEFDAIKFDTQLRSLKAFKHHPTEYRQIRSDLLDFIMNSKFVFSILENTSLSLIDKKRLQIKNLKTSLLDLIGNYQCEKSNEKETETANENLSTQIINEIHLFIKQIEKDDDVTSCQCCIKFPTKKLNLLKKKNEYVEYPDIHQIPKEIVGKLSWNCRRFQKNKKQTKGAFYLKKPINQDYYYKGINSLEGLLKVLGPENPGYTRNGVNFSNDIKDTLLSRLSFNCLFKNAKIPDGGSCCEWIATSLVSSQKIDDEYFSYLNNMRKKLHLSEIKFPCESQEINKQLRMSYAFSMRYGYDPYIREYMNYENDDDLNFTYCRNVIGYMKKFCSNNVVTDNIAFQECCRYYYSLTPSQVGKYGCMWGQDDFLRWFQCVFNIRIFLIHIQSFDVLGKTKITTSSDFVNSYVFENSPEFQPEKHCENDGIFDFKDKNKLIPYGIMIVLMEDQHYERVIIPFDQKSPLIPVGSVSVRHILPFLKISEKVWVSMSVDNVKQHNNEVIDTHELDRNKELNYWYDFQTASKKCSELKFSVIPPLTQTVQDYEKYSVPNCAIKYHGFYIAALCYLAAIEDRDQYSSIIVDYQAYLIELSENENDRKKILTTLKQENKKVYSGLSLEIAEDPFDEKNLVSHYDKCFVAMKDQIYSGYVEKSKNQYSVNPGNAVLYSPICQRTNLIDTTKKTIVDTLKSEGVIPNYLLKSKNKSKIEEIRQNLDSRKNNTLEKETNESVEKKNQLNVEDNLTSSYNEIFENCSTTSGGESSASSLISSVSMPSEKFSVDTTSSQSKKSSTHNSPILIDATMKNKSHITSPEDANDIESKTFSVKESSSSNHPTLSSTKIDTQISRRIINATTDSQINKSSVNNSNDFIDSTTKNISHITSPEDATDIDTKTLSVKESSASNHPTLSSSKIDTQISRRIINATTDSQNNKSSVNNSTDFIDSTTKNKSQITSPEDTSATMNIDSKTSSVKESSSSNHPTLSSIKFDTQISRRIINATTDSQNNKSSINNSTDFVDSTIKNKSQITSPEDTSATMNIEPNKSKNQASKKVIRIQMALARKMIKNKNLEEDNASNEDHTEKENTDEEDSSQNDDPQNEDTTEIESSDDNDSDDNESEKFVSETHDNEINSSVKSFDFEDVMEQNKRNMKFPLKFQYLKDPRLEMNSFGLIFASIKNHQKSFGMLDQFQFKENGKFANNQTKSYLTQLVSYSKKIYSTPRKRIGVFEGMYGFVSKKYFFILDSYNRYETYHWQYLKTKQIKKNDQFKYSRENSMDFLRGNKQMKVIHHLSSIAWLSLSDFLLQHKGSEQFAEIQYIMNSLSSKIGRDEFVIENEQKKKRKMIGSTPFTSLHVTHWSNLKKFEPEKRNNTDVIVSVMICFGPTNTSSDNPRFYSPNKGSISLKHNYVYIHFQNIDGPFIIQGNPKNFWMFTFQVEQSVINKIKQASNENWFQDITVKSIQKCNTMNIAFDPTMIKKKRKIFQDCDTITLGYIDLITEKKQEGNERSCLHDAFINAGYMFGKKIRDELYKECPPKKYTNSTLSTILKSSVIQRNFRIESRPNYTTEKGGNEWILLHNSVGTGVYIAWCYVHPSFSRKNAKRQKTKETSQKESHAFVYDSDFNSFNNQKFYGAIIDNRKNSYLRAFSNDDIKDVSSIRKSLREYFLGKTIIRGWIKITGLITS